LGVASASASTNAIIPVPSTDISARGSMTQM